MFFDQYGNLLVSLNPQNSSPGGITLLDGTTPTNKLAIDSSGRLTLVPNQVFELADSGGVNKLAVDTNGAATTQDLIRALTTAGKAYVVTTGKQIAPGSATLGFQLFNPANSGKSLLITRLTLVSAGASIHDVRLTSTDISTLTGYTSLPLTPVNKRAGGSASVATANSSNTNITGTPVGTSIYTPGNSANTTADILPIGAGILLPAATTVSGIAIYFNATGANAWAVGCEYLEF